MSFLRSSACVPKIACTLLPTSITPAAPRALSRALSTLSLSATSIRSRVMQASTLTRFSRPPKAAISCSALTSAAVLVATAVPPPRDGAHGSGGWSSSEVGGLLGLELVLRLAARGSQVPPS